MAGGQLDSDLAWLTEEGERLVAQELCPHTPGVDVQTMARTLTPGAPVLLRVQRADVVLYVVVTAAP